MASGDTRRDATFCRLNYKAQDKSRSAGLQAALSPILEP